VANNGPEVSGIVRWESVRELALRIPYSADWIYENAKAGDIPARKFKGKTSIICNTP